MLKRVSVCLVFLSGFAIVEAYAQPANDNCTDAFPIVVTAACELATFTNIDATSEPVAVAPNPSCGFFSGRDVWFTFEVPASGAFRIEAASLGGGTISYQLYTGTCGSFTPFVCDGGNTDFNHPEVAGETLYLRAFRTGSSTGVDFTLCIYETSPPTNDYCSGAISLTVGEECVPQTFTTFFATSDPSGTAPNPSCGFYSGKDVWFTFEVPASGAFRIEAAALTSGTVSYQLYTGTCGSFTQFFCEGGNTDFNHPALAGETLYLRAFRTGSSIGVDFTLCVYETAPPVNDFCLAAIALTVGEECVPQTFTTFFATADPSGTAPNPACGFYSGKDVWFTFEVPASGAFRIEAAALTSGTVSYQLYTGTCGSFTQFFCEGGNTDFNHPALAGETLYLRAFRTGSSVGIDFTLCIYETSPPTNDYCSGAISLTVGEECVPQTFTTFFATSDPSGTAPNPSCGFYSGKDVWFTFEVPASGGFRIETTALSAGSVAYQLYSSTCGSFTPVGCDEGNANFVFPGLIGQTVYLRAWRWGSSIGIDFNICVYEFEPHLNDNCAEAMELAVGSECNFQLYSSFFQTTESGIAPSPGCVGYSGGDVWFKVVMPASGKLRVEKSNVPGGINAQFALYTGTCGSFTNLACIQLTTSLNINNPSLAGQEIHIRVYAYGSDQGGEFQLCVWEPPIPNNDWCEEAFDIEVGITCQMQTFSNAYCTAEPGIAPNPTCGFFSGGDVWFKFVMPASGQIQIQRNNIANVNAQWAVYQGTCGSFTQVACAQLVNQININNALLAGQTLYLRFYNYGSAQGGTFEFCITNTAAPDNDNCADAIPLAVNQSCIMTEFHNANATAEPGIAPNPSCLGYSGGDVWFTVEVPASGNLRINRTNIAGVNAQLALYSGECGNMQEVVCAQLQSSVQVSDPLLAGETLYLRVFNYGSPQGGVFTLCGVEFDCNGDEGGTAYLDNCGICVGGLTGLDECQPDCAGVLGGSAYLDFCDECVGGTTGIEPCPAPCLVDFNNNGLVEFGDLSILLTEFGCPADCQYDVNGDGAVDFSDLSIFLSLYNGVCF